MPYIAENIWANPDLVSELEMEEIKKAHESVKLGSKVKATKVPNFPKEQANKPAQEVPMNNNVQYSDEQNAKQYLIRRLDSLESDKQVKLMRAFGMVDDESPNTPKELLKRIQDGKFFIAKHVENVRAFSPIDYFIWRDPSVKKDHDGYVAALDVLKEKSQQARDIIVVKNQEEGLKALQDFAVNA